MGVRVGPHFCSSGLAQGGCVAVRQASSCMPPAAPARLLPGGLFVYLSAWLSATLLIVCLALHHRCNRGCDASAWVDELVALGFFWVLTLAVCRVCLEAGGLTVAGA